MSQIKTSECSPSSLLKLGILFPYVHFKLEITIHQPIFEITHCKQFSLQIFTCLNCSSKLQLFWPLSLPPELLLPLVWCTGELRCEFGVPGCESGLPKPAGGGGACTGGKPGRPGGVGRAPAAPAARRLASSWCGDCEERKSLVCLLKASRVWSGGRPAAKSALGSLSTSLGSGKCGGSPWVSPLSSFIKSRWSWKKDFN